MARRRPKDVKWLGYLMSIEFFLEHYLAAADVADQILKVEPKHRNAIAMKYSLLEKRLATTIQRIKKENELRRQQRPVRARKPK